MGADSSYPEEGPAHDAEVASFWIDEYAVTNADFAAFAAATGYVTIAERPLDPAAYPDVAPELLKPGGAVFFMPSGRVDLREVTSRWAYVPGANWRHPEGPASTIDGHEREPVGQVAYQDAAAYAAWAGKLLPTETEWEFVARGGLEGAQFCWGVDGEYLAGPVPVSRPCPGRVCRARAGGLVSRQRLRPLRHGRQCLGVDCRLVLRPTPNRDQPPVLRPQHATGRSRGGWA